MSSQTVLPPTDMIAMSLTTLLQPLCDQLANLCACLRDTAQQPGVHSCVQTSFVFMGSVSQTIDCHIVTFVFQVPPGNTATTRVRLAERYPGTLYGAHFMIMVNDNLSTEFPRLDHPTGSGMEDGISTRICLQEQDIVSVLLQCSWFPIDSDGQAETYVQTIFPFEIEGFYELMPVDQPSQQISVSLYE